MFHERLCRQSFKQHPVKRGGTGAPAQRAIMTGGTLDNGKLRVYFQKSHGVLVRELIAMVRFEPHSVVTCYGGFVELAPSEEACHTHMRHIPETKRVLNGVEFASRFPCKPGVMFELGRGLPLRPVCANADWSTVIRTTGLGYMANTVTKCPLQRTRPNVTIQCKPVGRYIKNVPHGSSVVYLVAASKGIAVGDAVISPYEACVQTAKFRFNCADPAHYKAAGCAFIQDTP
jgi:hypothetical protein